MCSCCNLVHVEEVRKHFREAYIETQLQTNSKAEQQKQYYDKATSTMQLMLGDVIHEIRYFPGKEECEGQVE